MTNQPPPVYGAPPSPPAQDLREAAQEEYPELRAQSATAPGATVPPPPSMNPNPDMETMVARLIAERMAGVQSEFDQRIEALEKKHAEEMRALMRGAPLDSTPEHGAGPGVVRLATWGQWMQDLAKNGLLTAEHIAQAHGVNLEEAAALLARL